MPTGEDVVADIRQHLQRVQANQVRVRLDHQFEPETGTLLKVEHRGANWHMFAVDFRTLLEKLPDRAGPAAVHEAIESQIAHLWHGPSSPGSRDTSG